MPDDCKTQNSSPTELVSYSRFLYLVFNSCYIIYSDLNERNISEVIVLSS